MSIMNNIIIVIIISNMFIIMIVIIIISLLLLLLIVLWLLGPFPLHLAGPLLHADGRLWRGRLVRCLPAAASDVAGS